MFDIEDDIPIPAPKMDAIKLARELYVLNNGDKGQCASLALDKLGMKGFIGTKESAIDWLRRAI